MENVFSNLLADENVPKEIVLNLMLVYYGARKFAMIEYTNFKTYYSRDDFYIYLYNLIASINYTPNPICICIERYDDYPRYIIFQYSNFTNIKNIFDQPGEWHWKIGTLLEMSKPGEDFDDEKKIRIAGRIVVEKFIGIDLFAEVFHIKNVKEDLKLISTNLKNKLIAYNKVLTPFGYTTKIELHSL
jgi:hypothetical protein